MKQILVTGAAGFVGSNFVHFLHNKYPDYKIVVLDSLTYAGNLKNLPQQALDNRQIEFVYGSILNVGLVDKIVEKSDYIVHFAAETHVTRSIYDNSTFFQTDVLGTQAIANAVLKYADKVERFIHISTSEVYGTALDEKMDEDHPLNPMSPYASAKCGADRLVYSYYQTYQIPVTIIRPFNQFGPRQHLEKVIPRFISSCLLNDKITVHGDGSASRDWTYVDDTCRGIDLILHADEKDVVGEVFNLGNDEAISVKEIAEIICEKMSFNTENIVYISDRPGQVVRHTCNYEKLKNRLGWSPSVSFDNALNQTIDWYKNNKDLWEVQLWLREIEIENSKGLKQLH